MNNAVKAERENNQEKEWRTAEPYEISDAENDLSYIESFPNEKIATEIAKLLISKNLTYLEMNEVLYKTDKALRNKMLQTKLSL